MAAFRAAIRQDSNQAEAYQNLGALLIPPELEPYYTETLLPLSHSFVTSS